MRFLPKHVREQVLGVQARAFDLALLEIRRRRLEDFEHGHAFHGPSYAMATSGRRLDVASHQATQRADSFRRSCHIGRLQRWIISSDSPSMKRSRL